jgi:hypothetical protein
MQYSKGALVTVSELDTNSSNVFVVDSDLGDDVLLFHPLFQDCLIRFNKSRLDVSAPNLKDSVERGLDFAKSRASYLDYNTVGDLESLCLYFVVKRKLTPKQKSALSSINGVIASILLNNDVKTAMDVVKANEGLLDDFNAMWYRNFRGLFSGKQAITSKKQRAAIFNMAGFVLAELEKPSVPRV